MPDRNLLQQVKIGCYSLFCRMGKLLSGFGILRLAGYKWQSGMETWHFFPTPKLHVVSSLLLLITSTLFHKGWE